MQNPVSDTSGERHPRIAVVGVGQLGSRYVQGLVSSNLPLDIWLKDPSIDSLSRFEKWKTTYSIDIGIHSVKFDPTYSEFPDHFDLVISATTADIRFESLNLLLGGRTFDYMILEKLLTTKLEDLDALTVLVSRSKASWVNHPMRLWTHYQQLKDELQNLGPIQVTVEGTDWNVASNSSHYVDFVCWLTGEDLSKLLTSNIHSDWRESKRQGFVEFTGEIRYYFRGGSSLLLNSERPGDNIDASPISIRITTSGGKFLIEEATGLIQGDSIRGRFRGSVPLQSEITSGLVREILRTGECGLPKFEDVRHRHMIYLTELLDYQKRVHKNFSQTVMIT